MEKRKAAEQTVIVMSDGQEARVVVRNGVVLLPKGFKPVARRLRSRTKAPAGPATVNLAGLMDAPDYGPRAVTHRRCLRTEEADRVRAAAMSLQVAGP